MDDVPSRGRAAKLVEDRGKARHPLPVEEAPYANMGDMSLATLLEQGEPLHLVIGVDDAGTAVGARRSDGQPYEHPVLRIRQCS
ncbi:hypothetical protein GCM10028815_18520 [Mariniluteicoccus flavus]